jgi:hypothetical protein
MIAFTGGGFTQMVDGDKSYYLMQQASAQEGEVIDEEPTAEVDQPPIEEPPLSPPSTGATPFVSLSQEQEAVPEEQQQPPTPTNQTTTANPSAQAAETVLICGWVFNDINQNRKRDEGERGIEGATVTLEPASRGASIATASFKTEEHGSYCVSGGGIDIEDMPISFFVMVTPPQIQFTPFTPGEVEVGGVPPSITIQKPVVFTATTELVVAITFNESDGLEEVNFGFRQVEVPLPGVED